VPSSAEDVDPAWVVTLRGVTGAGPAEPERLDVAKFVCIGLVAAGHFCEPFYKVVPTPHHPPQSPPSSPSPAPIASPATLTPSPPAPSSPTKYAVAQLCIPTCSARQILTAQEMLFIMRVHDVMGDVHLCPSSQIGNKPTAAFMHAIYSFHVPAFVLISGRGLNSFPFPLNLSLPCPIPLN